MIKRTFTGQRCVWYAREPAHAIHLNWNSTRGSFKRESTRAQLHLYSKEESCLRNHIMKLHIFAVTQNVFSHHIWNGKLLGTMSVEMVVISTSISNIAPINLNVLSSNIFKKRCRKTKFRLCFKWWCSNSFIIQDYLVSEQTHYSVFDASWKHLYKLTLFFSKRVFKFTCFVLTI